MTYIENIIFNRKAFIHDLSLIYSVIIKNKKHTIHLTVL